MKKNILKYLLILVILFSIKVDAATINDGVGTDLNKYSCTSKYQDNNYNINGAAYFSHCMRAQCNNNKYNIVYYTNSMPKCSNGNTNFYYKLYKTGCSTYENAKSCTNNTEKYCSIIMYYDCSKKVDGSSFYTTTTKKVTTRKKTTSPIINNTTVAPTTSAKVDTSLSSLTLSQGNISFSKDVYEYSINVDSTVTSVIVNATATDPNSKIEIIGNENITNDSVINVVVTGINGERSAYVINVNVTNKLSSDARLKKLTVGGYDLKYDELINDYTLTIKEDVQELDINYETYEKTSVVLISNNADLKDGSVININVTAQDGTKKDYTINIKVKKKSTILGILFIIIIILAVLVGAYYIYKKVIASKVGEKYEYE